MARKEYENEKTTQKENNLKKEERESVRVYRK
jgi:hypothetical protein